MILHKCGHYDLTTCSERVISTYDTCVVVDKVVKFHKEYLPEVHNIGDVTANLRSSDSFSNFRFRLS